MNLEAVVGGRTLQVEVRGEDGRYTVVIDGREIEVDHLEAGRDFASLLIDGQSYEVGLERGPAGYRVVFPEAVIAVELFEATRGNGPLPRRGTLGPCRLTAPMPGKVVRVLLGPGQEAAAGQGVVVVEAMKMENELRAPRAGRILEVVVREGQAVETGALLAVLD